MNFPEALDFLQEQWARFERERAQWDAEKQRLMTEIMTLQRQLEFQDSQKETLIMRIKMLEASSTDSPVKNTAVPPPDASAMMHNIMERLGRSRTALRQYLRDMDGDQALARPELPVAEPEPEYEAPQPEPVLEEAPGEAEDKLAHFDLPPAMRRRMEGPGRKNLTAPSRPRHSAVPPAPQPAPTKPSAGLADEIGSLGSIAAAAMEDKMRPVASKSWTMYKIIRAHYRDAMSVSWTPDSAMVVSGGLDCTLRVWPAAKTSGETDPILTLRGHEFGILSTCVVGTTLYSADRLGCLKAWSLAPPLTPFSPHKEWSRRALGSNECHTDAIWSIMAHKKSVITVSADGSAKIWDSADLVTSNPLPLAECRGEFTVGAVSPLTNRLYLGTRDSVMEWGLDGIPGNLNIQTGGPVVSIAIHPTRKIIAVGIPDSVLIVDLDKETITQSFKPHDGPLSSLDFTPDGLSLVTASHAQSIRAWSTETWACTSDTSAHRVNWGDAIHTVRVSPSGGHVASAGADGQVVVLH
ncbi:WD domain G-beta repeat [Carpediemonas membranifera]|uniref:WD domain G-beta repeat n=1 Tax=Carpediemonas membranifera TaxID=201153 RepID=A0A8J6BBV8_9EUKA|nr:WD domain G-beta repeat [Carpediemonas membranifera]|eukprot:KAG9397022.1 WD domain G-beta repeat [Carpediemonas membranifera]